MATGIYVVVDYFIDLPPAGLIFYAETVTAMPKGDDLVYDCRYEFKATHHGRPNTKFFVRPTRMETRPCHRMSRFSFKAVVFPFKLWLTDSHANCL